MTNDIDIVNRIKAILSRPAEAIGNVELQELLESAIRSGDQETRAFATKAWMSLGATVFPIIASYDSDEGIDVSIAAAMDTFDEHDIEDSSEELLTTFGLTADDAAELIKEALRLREEARLKSGFYKVDQSGQDS